MMKVKKITNEKTPLKKAINALCSELCRLEGKKSQIKVGDMRELMGKFAEMYVVNLTLNGDLSKLLIHWGRERLLKRFKKEVEIVKKAVKK